MTAAGFSIQYAIRLPDGQLAVNPYTSGPYLWEDEASALKSLEILRHQAAQIGVSCWAGAVVRRYCTPFVGADDPGEQFLDELSTWLKQQTGDGGTQR